jgi:hypothetical protein
MEPMSKMSLSMPWNACLEPRKTIQFTVPGCQGDGVLEYIIAQQTKELVTWGGIPQNRGQCTRDFAENVVTSSVQTL